MEKIFTNIRSVNPMMDQEMISLKRANEMMNVPGVLRCTIDVESCYGGEHIHVSKLAMSPIMQFLGKIKRMNDGFTLNDNFINDDEIQKALDCERARTSKALNDLSIERKETVGLADELMKMPAGFRAQFTKKMHDVCEARKAELEEERKQAEADAAAGLYESTRP